MKDETAQPRNFKDRALVWISGLLAGGHVPLVPDSPRLLRVVDRQLFAMAPTQEETDRTFLAEDGSIWTFEFQFRHSDVDIARMAGYHLSLVRQYPKQAVHTVVFWGTAAALAAGLQVQHVIFQPHQVFLRAMLPRKSWSVGARVASRNHCWGARRRCYAWGMVCCTRLRIASGHQGSC